MPRLRRWASALEDFLPVVTQKLRVGFGKFIRQTNRLVLEWDEILFECDLWKETFQPLAQNNAQLLVERDESVIERSVVKC